MTGHWPFFKFMILLSLGRSSAGSCDQATIAQMREGNLGQTGDFNWLGVLHVHLHQDWIATTGIVLIKFKYALAIADDVARIPKHIFKSDSSAMFLATQDKPWFVKPASYVTHPEYEDSMRNSIAIIELDLEELNEFPLTPICLSTMTTFDASRYLYLTGFTHENQVLEKFLYKIKYLDNEVCDEFYNGLELSSKQVMPSACLCGYSPNSATQCVWDNGMTLVSNEFGYFNLIGFSIHGPGCTAPARFIDLLPYFPWINSITENRRMEIIPINGRRVMVPSTRRNEFIPKNKRKGLVPNIPIHQLFPIGGSRRDLDDTVNHEFEPYPFELEALKFHLVKPDFDGNTYYISPSIKDKWEETKDACTRPTVLMYHETFVLTAGDNMKGSATYKLSLYDKVNPDCVCVRLTVVCDNGSDAILSFKEVMNFREDTYHDGDKITPGQILKSFPIPKTIENPKKSSELLEWHQELLKPVDDNLDDVLPKIVLNYDLYITFNFTKRAKLDFEMLAEKLEDQITINIKDRRRRKNLKSHEKVNKTKDMLRKVEVSVIEEKMHDMQTVARGEAAPGAAVMVGWLIACLSTVAFIH